jgi:hypothetical protein
MLMGTRWMISILCELLLYLFLALMKVLHRGILM